ncbi:MAG: PQQ-binding-like beta-propeller repeat protein [Ferruginibacter sp.]
MRIISLNKLFFTRNKLCALFAAAIVFFSCSKSSDVADPNNPNPTVSHLTAFSVTVKERIPNRAIISWTASQNIFNTDIVKYKVSLNGNIVHTDLLNTVDTLNALSKDTIYTGKVIAYTVSGDTVSAPFLLEAYNGFIYVTLESDMQLGCYNSYTNSVSNPRLWNKPFDHQNGMPTIANGTIYLSNTNTASPSLFAMNANNGNVIWSNSIRLINETSPTYFNGKLYANTYQGVLAINAADGQVDWTYQNGLNDMGSNPVIDNNKVFVGNRSSSGYISALNLANGSLLWTFPFDGQMCTRPLVSNNLVIFGCSMDKIYALDQSTGNVAWSRELATTNHYGTNWVSPILVNRNLVIVHTANHGFFALNVLTGATVWTYDNTDPGVSTPAYGNGFIYFTTTVVIGSDYRAKIVALNASTGQLQWENTTTSQSLFYLVYAKNKLFMREYYNILVVNPYTGVAEAHIVDLNTSLALFGLSINNTSFYNGEHGNYK